jgi:hypothetical protein
MKKSLFGLAVLALATLSFAPNASADMGYDVDAAFGLVGFGALDVGLVVADLAAGAQGEWRSRVYGGFEATVGGAQFAICLNQVLSAGPNRSTGTWEIGAGLGAILMTHGLVTLLAPRPHTESPTPPAPVTITPLALSDVARGSVPGVAVLGLF